MISRSIAPKLKRAVFYAHDWLSRCVAIARQAERRVLVSQPSSYCVGAFTGVVENFCSASNLRTAHRGLDPIIAWGFELAHHSTKRPRAAFRPPVILSSTASALWKRAARLNNI